MLLEVQKAALQAAGDKRGFAYFLEQGLGKTLLTLTEFRHRVETGEATRLVVVCPNSFKSGWVEEIKKHGIVADPFIFESGSPDVKFFLRKKFEKPPVLIVNYEAIRRDHVQDTILKFISGRNAMLVFDESIQIKTHNSQQTKAALFLARHFEFVRILSGKPSTQGPHDLWSQFRAIGQMNGMNFWAFRNTFCRMGGYLNKQVIGIQNEDILIQRMAPFVFRATKDQWTDLPPKIYTTRECQMAPEQARQYRTMESDFVTWLQSGEYITVDMAITKYIKLAQAQFGFMIDESEKVHELVAPSHNTRISLIKEIIDTEVIGKVVVVYHHKYAGRVLQDELAKFGLTFIQGNMEPSHIAANKQTFNEDPDCRVIVIQDTAGKYGHTLLGSGTNPEMRCSTMIFAENSWSLDTRAQLEDRIHRHGQNDSCLYVDVVNSSLDRRIAAALQKKENIFKAVFEPLSSYAENAEDLE